MARELDVQADRSIPMMSADSIGSGSFLVAEAAMITVSGVRLGPQPVASRVTRMLVTSPMTDAASRRALPASGRDEDGLMCTPWDAKRMLTRAGAAR